MDTDRELMQRVAGRDERAFAELMKRFGARLFAVAHRLLGSRADAEDALQQAFLACFRSAHTYRAEWAVSTWLYRIVTNVCVDEMRRRAARARLTESIEEAAPRRGFPSRPRETHGSEREMELRRAWPAVPREARILLALRYVDGLSYKELARIRGISVNTVKSQIARGKAILSAALGERHPAAPNTKRPEGARRR
jgi:RNA polymerase sigma-70 factor (ECF subfamily)